MVNIKTKPNSGHYKNHYNACFFISIQDYFIETNNRYLPFGAHNHMTTIQ